jgi:hypothetical protein
MKSFKQVVNMVVELVREEIGRQIKDAKVGSIMDDGWSKNSIQYIGVIAIYIKSYVAARNLLLSWAGHRICGMIIIIILRSKIITSKELQESLTHCLNNMDPNGGIYMHWQ